MKTFLILFLTIPMMGFAQECKVKKEKDSFSQQAKVSTGFMKITGASVPLSVNMEADKQEIKLLFSFGEGTCFDDQSTAAIQFDGTKSKSNQKNSSSMNCDGIFTLIFRNGTSTPYALQKISTTKMSMITFVGNGKQKTEISFSEEDKQKLMERAACIVAEAKKLTGTP